MKAAAIQLEAKLADVPANLQMCEELADQAGAQGADLIALPEFFSTGIGFTPELADCALPVDGAATDLLLRLAERHGALVGGSFLCRDPDGEVRNAYLLAGPGGIAGRHDKDLPTMWENAYYVGGSDDGVIQAGELRVGAAVCWELMRTQTVRRLAGRIDIAMTGSGWWSMPENWPFQRKLEARNEVTARTSIVSFAGFVGAPVLHAAHSGELTCDMPWIPGGYRGHFQGGAVICDGHGRVLAKRDRLEGPGVVTAEIEPGAVAPSATPPDRFWLHRRDWPAVVTWHLQRLHGPGWYAKHVRQAPQTHS
ncbi:MAG: deaminated glutathione amidase [Thermoleophilaceae bacterium]|nr:deaminated glutathione amidase [Thermoleophilaceae bacterium]